MPLPLHFMRGGVGGGGWMIVFQFSKSKIWSCAGASGYLPFHPHNDQILDISPSHLVSGIVHTLMLVQALPFINWMIPSNTLKLYEPRSPLAWDTRHQATTSAGTDALGRSALFVVCPLLLLLGWGRQSFSSLIIHENEISASLSWNCSSKHTKIRVPNYSSS